MNNPLVTIITITYNLINAGRVETFKQCLESVHNQTYKNIEHIIIDGASKDGTIELLEEYKNKGYITYFSEPDNGVYNAFNKGIERANGKYIAFLNTDDYYHSELGVQKSVEALEDSGASYSVSPLNVIDENDKFLFEFFVMMPRVYYTTPYCHQSMFCKKELLEKYKFDEQYKLGSDYDLTLKLFTDKIPYVVVNHNFATYRLGGLSCIHEKEMNEEYKKIQKKYLNSIYKFSQIEHEIMLKFGLPPILFLLKFKKYFSKEEFDEFIPYFKKLIKTYKKWRFEFKIKKEGIILRILGHSILYPNNYMPKF